MEKNTSNKRSKKQKMISSLGVAVVIFAVIGFITVITISVNLTSKLFDRSGDMEEFERLIMPVVMFDPVPFTSVDKADESLIKQASIWACLMSEKRNTYGYDDSGMLILPASDVEVMAASLFGSETTITHETFGSYDNTYYYDEYGNLYKVPILSLADFYRPDVVEIDQKGDTVNLTVGYIPPGDILSLAFGEESSLTEPDKYMEYTLQETKAGYKVVSIQAINTQQPQSSDTPVVGGGE